MTAEFFIGRSSSSDPIDRRALRHLVPQQGQRGQAMLDNFHPIMQPASVKQTVSLMRIRSSN